MSKHYLAELGMKLAGFGRLDFKKELDLDAAAEAIPIETQKAALLAAIYLQLETLCEAWMEDKTEVPVADGILNHLNRTRAT